MSTRRLPTINRDAPLAVDAMGGDGGVPVAVAGVLRVLRQRSHLEVILIGQQSLLETELARRVPRRLRSRIVLQDAAQVIDEKERPAAVLRRERAEQGDDTSIGAAIEAVRSGRASACVSAGSSGALMSLGLNRLGTWPGVERPAICCRLPAAAGHSLLLDAGANVDIPPRRLVQFARLGALLAAAETPQRIPRIALLSIGTEQDKGSRQVRETAQLLIQEKDLHYVGLLEGHDLFSGLADVILCDGFVGNIALKAAEGAAGRVLHHVRRRLESHPLRRLLLRATGIGGSELGRGVEPGQHNGACLLGLRGIVVKSHGSAGATAFAAALDYACQQVASGTIAAAARYFAASSPRPLRS